MKSYTRETRKGFGIGSRKVGTALFIIGVTFLLASAAIYFVSFQQDDEMNENENENDARWNYDAARWIGIMLRPGWLIVWHEHSAFEDLFAGNILIRGNPLSFPEGRTYFDLSIAEFSDAVFVTRSNDPNHSHEKTTMYVLRFRLEILLALFLLMLVPYLAARWRLRYRRKHGLCLNCGYAVFACAGKACPECGTEFFGSTEATAEP
jgi:hypothetical protein